MHENLYYCEGDPTQAGAVCEMITDYTASEKEGEVTEEMKELLFKIADLCTQASDEVYADRETSPILKQCDELADAIDEYLGTVR